MEVVEEENTPQEETLVFSLGTRFPRLKKRDRIRYNLKKKQERLRKAAKTKEKKRKQFMFPPSAFCWTTTPHIQYSKPHLAKLLPLAPIVKWTPWTPIRYSEQEDFCRAWSMPPYTGATDTDFWSSQWATELADEFIRMRDMHWRLRRFLHMWRAKHLKKVNTEDIVTCEIPVYPVEITDWSKRQQWVFEASTLMRDITSRLYNHDGFFEQPLIPRNPLTNLSLTHAQVQSVWMQIQRYPIAQSTVFHAFRQSRMNLNSFRFDYRIPLQLHALRITMNEFTHYDAHDRLLDFIDLAYTRQGAECLIHVWEHAVYHLPNHEVIQRWRAICLKFYELELRYATFPTKKQQLQEKLFPLTYPLLHKQPEMAELVPEPEEEEEEETFDSIVGIQVLYAAAILQNLPLS